MGRQDTGLKVLQRLLPSANGLTVFDAETQETSYGIRVFDKIPFIFDTHRKEGHYIATIELLTEVVTPLRIGPGRLARFCDACRELGLLPIPYTGCFFEENLHIYSFSGPVRGFDLAALGRSAVEAERTLADRVSRIRRRIPHELHRVQQGILAHRRKVRHPADLDVLLRHRHGAGRRSLR